MSRGTTATFVGSSSRCLGHLRGSGISKQGVLKRAGRLQTSRWYKDTEHVARRSVLSRSIRLQICSKRTSGREFQSRLCVSVGSAIGVFGACKPAGKWIRAGERRSFSSCGRAVSGGVYGTRELPRKIARAGEQGTGGNGVRPTMGKRGGRRREEEEEWKTGKKVHSISILLVLLPGYTVLRSVNSYTDDMWVYHNRAHMSFNGGQRCVGVFAEACSTGKHDCSTG